MNYRSILFTFLLFLLCSSAFASSTTYTYDELDRIKTVTFENGQVVTYEYDEIGNIISKIPSGNVFTIAASASDYGSIFPKGTTIITSGGNKTYWITPSEGYVISDVFVDGVSKGAVTPASLMQ